MNSKALKSWAGLFSIAWMIGIFLLLVLIHPENIPIEPPWWRLLVLSFANLGVGLLLAFVGLKHGGWAGRGCAVVAGGLFLFFVWFWVLPAFQHPHAK